MLFEVAIIQHPTPEEEKAGNKPIILMEPKAVVAKDRDTALIAALGTSPLRANVRTEALEVLVRPFV